MADEIKSPKVFVGITTLPSRIQHMEPCLRSLLKGRLVPDQIFVSLPALSIREKTAYSIPGFFSSPEFSTRVTIVRPERDYGPGTKLLGFLGRIAEPAYIVILDDDMRYRSFVVDILVKYQKLDHRSSFSFHTYLINGLRVGQGADGFSFWSPNLAGIFDFCDQYVANSDLMFHDDLWISFFLMSRGISVNSLARLRPAWMVYDKIHSINQLLSETGPLSRPALNGLVSRLFRDANVPRGVYQGLLKGSRNNPCICGSGKRYKQCHGALV